MSAEFPDVVPLFPLPNVVLFPGLPLPLHIFEPRYRAMVRDALDGSRLIGMVLLRGDWKPLYDGKLAPIFALGTAGEIVRSESLPDGRFEIVLRGRREFVVGEEIPGDETPYRRARVQWRDGGTERVPSPIRDRLLRLVGQYAERVGHAPISPPKLEDAADDALFVNALAQQIDVAAVEKQALLEAPSLEARAAALCDVLAFRVEAFRAPGGASSGQLH